jgi:hypothetical protein
MAAARKLMYPSTAPKGGGFHAISFEALVTRVSLGLRPQATLQAGSRPRGASSTPALEASTADKPAMGTKRVLLKRRSATFPMGDAPQGARYQAFGASSE